MDRTDEDRAEEPAGVRFKVGDPVYPKVVCDACWDRRGGGGAPPPDCPECGGLGMVPRPAVFGA